MTKDYEFITNCVFSHKYGPEYKNEAQKDKKNTNIYTVVPH